MAQGEPWEKVIEVPVKEHTGDGEVLHIIRSSEWPVALCGHITKELFDINRATEGRDRCTECLRILAILRKVGYDGKFP